MQYNHDEQQGTLQNSQLLQQSRSPDEVIFLRPTLADVAVVSLARAAAPARREFCPLHGVLVRRRHVHLHEITNKDEQLR